MHHLQNLHYPFTRTHTHKHIERTQSSSAEPILSTDDKERIPCHTFSGSSYYNCRFKKSSHHVIEIVVCFAAFLVCVCGVRKELFFLRDCDGSVRREGGNIYLFM